MTTSIQQSAIAGSSAASENFLPNCQWQLWGQTSYINKMNSAGTDQQYPNSITSFNTTNGQPTLATPSTAELKNGDIGIVGFNWGYPGVGYVPNSGQYLTASRVSNVVANTSFNIQGNFTGVSPATSAATYFQPICPGDNGVGGGLSASGWLKSGALAVWADDFAINRCPGAIRVLGARKTTGDAMVHYVPIQSKKMRKYAGRTITLGVKVFQKKQSGSGTWRLFIDDGVNHTSSAGAGVSVGGYEFKTFTVKVSDTPTQLNIGLIFDGAAGDIYYVALPTCVFGSSLNEDDLKQRPDEIIESIHWNPPLLTPFVIAFPATELVPGSGLYGWNNIDLEAISLGTCHASLASTSAKFEWKSKTVGAYVFAADHTSNQHLRFGVQAITQVANVNDTDSGAWPLWDDGTISLFGTVPSMSGHILTLDFWDVVA